MGGISTSKWPHSSCSSRVSDPGVWGLPAGSGPSTCPTVVDPFVGSLLVWVVEETGSGGGCGPWRTIGS
jgi:hypothetical protein